MRLCDLLRYFNGRFTVRLYKEENLSFKIFKEGSLKDFEEECNYSFHILNGFNQALWETRVEKWGVDNDIINVLLKV